MKKKYLTIKCVTSNIYMQYTYYLKNQRKKKLKKAQKLELKRTYLRVFSQV